MSSDPESTPEGPIRQRDGEFLQSLDKGLRVIRAFSSEHPAMTLSDVARATGLTRATARRILHTLVALGYAQPTGRLTSLTPKVLDLGYSYLSSLDLMDLAQPEVEALVERTGESSSAAVLDDLEIVYVLRVPTRRIMAISLGLGTRLPATSTSMGRMLLSTLEPDELTDVLARSPLESLTERTITDRSRLREELDRVREQGWALVDQELEMGVRSVAVALHDSSAKAIAALNVSSHAGRVPLARLRGELLPMLQEAGAHINGRLSRR